MNKAMAQKLRDEGFLAFEKKEYSKAFDCSYKCAEQGYLWAQCLLGALYAEGLGVEQDYQKAAEWYRRAAEQGLAAAQNIMGFMYETQLSH